MMIRYDELKVTETCKPCILCGGNFMQINLSEETIKTVCRALRSEKNNLQGMLKRIEVGTASKEKEEEFKSKLAEAEDALQIFEELTQ